MLSSTSSKWYMGAALASVLVLVAGWFLLVSPQRSNADALNAEAEAKTAQNVATQKQIKALAAQYKDLPALEQQLAAVRARIPNTPNMPSVIREVSKDATTAGVKLVSFTPSAPVTLASLTGAQQDPGLQAPGEVNAYNVTINLTGRFANVRLMLNQLERMQRSFLVTNVDIARDDSTEAQTGALVVTVTGRVFTANPGLPAPSKPATSTTNGAAAPAEQAS